MFLPEKCPDPATDRSYQISTVCKYKFALLLPKPRKLQVRREEFRNRLADETVNIVICGQ
jgi:hypothetical protein